MKVNPGFPGRFRHKLHFEDWSDEQLSELVMSRFEKGVPPGRPYDLEDKEAIRCALMETFCELRKCAGDEFGNARDAVSLYKAIETAYFIRSGRLRAAQGHINTLSPPITCAPVAVICFWLRLPHSV